MNIIDVEPFFYPYMGGIERRIDDTSRLFTENGHKVTVLTGRLPGTEAEEEYNGYRILRLDSRLFNLYNPPYISSEGVLEAIESIDPDIVNFNYRWAPSYSRDLRRYDGRKVFTYHNMWGEGIGIQAYLSAVNDGLFRKTLDTFDHIISVSDFVRDDLIRRGYSGKYITSVPTCLGGFPETGDGSGDFILSLGRLVRTKGLDYLIEAMVDVDFKLIICGKGPDEKRLRRLIDRFDVSDRVEMRGFVSDEERGRLMGACRFFVMPSLFESFGLAAVELMSHGRPIICTDVNGLPETVGDSAVVVAPRDPKALADAINLLLDDRPGCEVLAAKARSKAEGYDWKDHLPKIEDVYRRVISGEYSETDAYDPGK